MLESRALSGAVAQLGERRVRNAKVEGSIPFRSTNSLFSQGPTKPKALRDAEFLRDLQVHHRPGSCVEPTIAGGKRRGSPATGLPKSIAAELTSARMPPRGRCRRP